ncbi:MAG: hypothetical protein ACREBD_08430, partial [Blastocatellia bacterium]
MALTRILLIFILPAFSLAGCQANSATPRAVELPSRDLAAEIQVKPGATPLEKINASAIEQTTQTTSYDPAYVKLDYP